MSFQADSIILSAADRRREASSKILEKVSKKPQPPVWLAEAPDAAGHPNDADLEVLTHQLSELFAGQYH